MGELDHRLDDDLVGRVGGPGTVGHGVVLEAPHERAVQFQHRDRQPAEVGQVRVAGAEVVDGDVDAHVAERLEDLERASGRAHHRRLGQFQLQQVGGEARLLQGAGHVRDQVGVPDLAHGHVDADEDRRLAGVGQLPAAGLVAGGAQDPAAEGNDRSILLRQCDEPIRRQYAELGMVPADERLDTPHPAVRHADQRLVLERELAALDGGTERGGQCLAGHAVGVALGVEEGPAGPAVGLGPVQGGVGGLHQGGGGGAGGVAFDDADRGGDRQPPVTELEGRLEGGQDRSGQVGELVGAGGVLDQEGELVPAEPGHQGCAGPGVGGLLRAPGQPFGHGGEQPVADPVAVGVVDGLEAVQVEVAHADPAGAAVLVRLRLQRRRQAFEEQGAVGQPGHRVVHLEVAQPCLELAPGTDVGDGEQQPRGVPGLPGVGQRFDRDLRPQGVSVGLLEPSRAAQPGPVPAQHLAVGVPGAGVGGEVDEVGRRAAGERGRVGAEQGAQGVVGADDQALGVDDGHGERGRGEHRAVGGGFRTPGTRSQTFVTFRDGRRAGVCRGRRPFGGSVHRSLPQCLDLCSCSVRAGKCADHRG